MYVLWLVVCVYVYAIVYECVCCYGVYFVRLRSHAHVHVTACVYLCLFVRACFVRGCVCTRVSLCLVCVPGSAMKMGKLVFVCCVGCSEVAGRARKVRV